MVGELEVPATRPSETARPVPSSSLEETAETSSETLGPVPPPMGEEVGETPREGSGPAAPSRFARIVRALEAGGHAATDPTDAETSALPCLLTLATLDPAILASMTPREDLGIASAGPLQPAALPAGGLTGMGRNSSSWTSVPATESVGTDGGAGAGASYRSAGLSRSDSSSAGEVADATSPTGSTASSRGVFRVIATAEGLIGGRTATGSIIKKWSEGAALPSRKALGKSLAVTYLRNGQSADCTVGDVGPWNTRDPYWEKPNGRPQAESGRDTRGRRTNRAGLDLYNATWYRLLKLRAYDRRLIENTTGEVEWQFN